MKVSQKASICFGAILVLIAFHPSENMLFNEKIKDDKWQKGMVAEQISDRYDAFSCSHNLV